MVHFDPSALHVGKVELHWVLFSYAQFGKLRWVVFFKKWSGPGGGA